MNGAGVGRLEFPGFQGSIQRAIVEFIRAQLAPWRDDPRRKPASAEGQLNEQLCKFLNAAARRHFSTVMFHHEQRQGNRHSVDLSAGPIQELWVGSRFYTIYDPFLVMEGKRLPAPTRDREREYVTGTDRPTGGIQRFKLGLHGGADNTAVMIGYLQSGSSAYWVGIINGWLDKLAAQKPLDGIDWRDDRPLCAANQAGTVSDVATFQSAHSRVTPSGTAVRIFHLWVCLVSSPNTKRR